MLFGLGWPEWLLIIGLIVGLWLTFRIMARASVAYDRARKARALQAPKEKEVGEEEGTWGNRK